MEYLKERDHLIITRVKQSIDAKELIPLRTTIKYF